MCSRHGVTVPSEKLHHTLHVGAAGLLWMDCFKCADVDPFSFVWFQFNTLFLCFRVRKALIRRAPRHPAFGSRGSRILFGKL